MTGLAETNDWKEPSINVYLGNYCVDHLFIFIDLFFVGMKKLDDANLLRGNLCGVSQQGHSMLAS